MYLDSENSWRFFGLELNPLNDYNFWSYVIGQQLLPVAEMPYKCQDNQSFFASRTVIFYFLWRPHIYILGYLDIYMASLPQATIVGQWHRTNNYRHSTE